MPVLKVAYNQRNLYDLPSFRLILSAISTPTCKKGKFLVPILEPLTTNEYAIKDSFTFAEELQSFDSKLLMASFDVESLFTNTPLQETIDLCVENLLEVVLILIICRKTLPVSYLLRLCLNHWSYLISSFINSMMELQWVPH